VRVVVVDDNELWRSSVVAALTSCEITVVSDLADGDALLALMPELQGERVDVAVLDLRLPPTYSDEGIALAHKIRAALPEVGIIMLSGYEQDVQLHYASRTLSDLAGSSGIGYLFKDRVNRSSLTDAIRRVADGSVVVDSLFA
jgi:DNA-binding NarL/FixJ family response regulator